MNPDPDTPSTVALVIDDEPQIRRLLRVTLEGDGYRVFDAATGEEGILAAAQRRPEIILLDLGLPDLDGLQVLRRIREWSRVPIVILTVRDQEADKVTALDTGANDYVTKPFASGELLARLRAARRHSQPDAASAVFHCGDLVVDLPARRVHRGNQEIRLTPTEYALLRVFVVHAGRVLTHKALIHEVWGQTASDPSHALRVHIAHLRDKIEPAPAEPTLIRTEPGIGYRFQSP
ncbi:MAG: response regulator [Verrucomicrobiales bacterium]|nr:response regulator [Verrucomicrobiales bacterium]